jgi:hypothetical protein
MTIKIMTALLALTFILTALASCGAKSITDGANSTEEELRVVGTINGYDVCFDEYRYVVLSCKDIMAARYGESIWDDEASAASYEGELKEMVAKMITANYAIFSLCAENGYTDPLTNKEAVKAVNMQIEELLSMYAYYNGIDVEISEKGDGTLKYKYEAGGIEKVYEYFNKDLANTYLTERVMRLTLGAEYAFEELVRILTVEKNQVIHLDKDIEEYMMSDKFICTRHVFIQNDDGESIDANREIAKTVLSMYNEGSSMDQLIGSKYNDDVTTSYFGTYFTGGEMDEAYENAAFALGIGEVSGIVETREGFYIIERCEKNADYIRSNFDIFADQITYAIINDMVRTRQAELSITLNEYGSSLVLHNIPTTRIENEGEKENDK